VPKPTQQLILRWEAAYATAFQIQTSGTGSSWTTIFSTTTGAGGTQTLPRHVPPGVEGVPGDSDNMFSTNFEFLRPAEVAAAQRVIVEASWNAVKHAQARNLWLETRRVGSVVIVRVRDDGARRLPVTDQRADRRPYPRTDGPW